MQVPVCQAKSQALFTLCFPILFMSILNTTILFLKSLFTKCSSSFDARKWGHAAAHSKARRIHPSVRRTKGTLREQPRDRSDDNWLCNCSTSHPMLCINYAMPDVRH